MKAELQEYDGCFSIHLTPETIEEATKVVRLGMNSTKVIRSCDACAANDGTFYGSVVIAKHRKANSYVPKRSR